MKFAEFGSVTGDLRMSPQAGDRYQAMLNEFLFTKIEVGDIGNIWFQQDGAKCYTGEA